MNTEIASFFALFFDVAPNAVKTIDTSRGVDDFRAAFIVETEEGKKYVLKLAENDFTFPEKINVWRRTAEEYRKLGYYCPEIHPDKTGSFPLVDYAGHRCTAYAEDFAPFRPAENRFSEDDAHNRALYDSYQRDIWKMTARIAALRLDYTEYPSAYCLFETFCPSDKTDEVLENALAWKKYANTLSQEFHGQVERIWRLWTENRTALEPLYKQLPTSVFQADLNPSNILLDDAGRFVGVYDFNLCGRDVFLNYLMREIFDDFQREISMICDALKTAKEDYCFSAPEKDVALMLYRCLKPLSFIRVDALKNLGTDREAIGAFLDETEHYLTAEINFREFME